MGDVTDAEIEHSRPHEGRLNVRVMVALAHGTCREPEFHQHELGLVPKYSALYAFVGINPLSRH